MKLLFSTLVLASGAAMAGAATLPVMAAMCCLLRKRMGARRALDARYARIGALSLLAPRGAWPPP